MFHLPKDGARVYVWPAPDRKIADHAPRGDEGAIAWMNPNGRPIVWDGFRYRQYLQGEIHFHDPRTDAQRKADQAQSLSKEDQALVLADPEYSEELKAELDKGAAPAAAEPAAAAVTASSSGGGGGEVVKLEEKPLELEQRAETKAGKTPAPSKSDR